MIRLVIRCPNDMVAVFDEKGEQVPEYQGHYDEVKQKILADAPGDCIFESYLYPKAVSPIMPIDRKYW